MSGADEGRRTGRPRPQWGFRWDFHGALPVPPPSRDLKRLRLLLLRGSKRDDKDLPMEVDDFLKWLPYATGFLKHSLERQGGRPRPTQVRAALRDVASACGRVRAAALDGGSGTLRAHVAGLLKTLDRLDDLSRTALMGGLVDLDRSDPAPEGTLSALERRLASPDPAAVREAVARLLHGLALAEQRVPRKHSPGGTRPRTNDALIRFAQGVAVELVALGMPVTTTPSKPDSRRGAILSTVVSMCLLAAGRPAHVDFRVLRAAVAETRNDLSYEALVDHLHAAGFTDDEITLYLPARS